VHKKTKFRFYIALIFFIISVIWAAAVLTYDKGNAGPFIGLLPFYVIMPTLFGYGLGALLDFVSRK
jgi:hypothetical protein